MSETAKIRIEVSAKGETGYLRTETDFNLRTHRFLELDPARADSYPTREWAEKHMRLLESAEQRAVAASGRRGFDSARIVEVQA